MWNLLRFLKNLEAKLMHILYARAQLRKLRAREREGGRREEMKRGACCALAPYSIHITMPQLYICGMAALLAMAIRK